MNFHELLSELVDWVRYGNDVLFGMPTVWRLGCKIPHWVVLKVRLRWEQRDGTNMLERMIHMAVIAK